MPPLEALLSDLPVFSIGHLAQSVGIAAPVVGSGAPEHLQFKSYSTKHKTTEYEFSTWAGSPLRQVVVAGLPNSPSL